MIDACLQRTLPGPLRQVCLKRDFLVFTAGLFVSANGLWMQQIALGWVVLELSNSAFVLGLVAFARSIPILFLGLPAGALAERVERRKLLLAAQCGSGAVAATIALSAWLDAVSVPLIVGLALLAGVCDSVAWPVITLFVKDIVGPEQLRLAVAINQARFNLTRVIGPAVGGFLLAWVGPAATLGAAAVALLGVVAALLLVRARGEPRAAGDQTPWLLRLREGVRYACCVPRVRRLLVITTGVGFFLLPFQQLLPAVARDRLQLGPEGLGLLTSAVGLGAIVGAVLSPTRFAQRHTRPLLVALPVGAGLALVMVGQARVLPIAAVALAVVGLCTIAYMVIANAVMQLIVHDEVSGRVVGLMTVVQGGVMPIGALTLGGAADGLGLPIAFLVAGAGVAVVAVAAGGRAAADWLEENGADDPRQSVQPGLRGRWDPLSVP